MSNFKTNFQTSLRTARQSANLTQREMAARLSVSRSAYTYYETGRVQPSPQVLADICRILGISADTLLGLR